MNTYQNYTAIPVEKINEEDLNYEFAFQGLHFSLKSDPHSHPYSPKSDNPVVQKIQEAEQTVLEKIWYVNFNDTKINLENGNFPSLPNRPFVPPYWNFQIKCAEKLEQKYGKDKLNKISDQRYFELTGALSALQWVLDEMDVPVPDYRRPI